MSLRSTSQPYWSTYGSPAGSGRFKRSHAATAALLQMRAPGRGPNDPEQDGIARRRAAVPGRSASDQERQPVGLIAKSRIDRSMALATVAEVRGVSQLIG